MCVWLGSHRVHPGGIFLKKRGVSCELALVIKARVDRRGGE